MEQSQEVDSPPEGGFPLDGKKDDPGGGKENSPERSTDQVEETPGGKASAGSSIPSSTHFRRKLLPRYSVLRVANSEESGLQGGEGNDADSGFILMRRSSEERSRGQQTIHFRGLSTRLTVSPTSDRRHCPGSPTHGRTKYGPGGAFGKGDGKIKSALTPVVTRRTVPTVSASWIQTNGLDIHGTWSSRNSGEESGEGVRSSAKGATPPPKSPRDTMDIILKPPMRRVPRYSSNIYHTFSAPVEESPMAPLMRSESNPSSPTSQRESPSPFHPFLSSETPSSATPLSTPRHLLPSLFSLCSRGIHLTHSVTPEEVSTANRDNVMHMTISTMGRHTPSLHVVRAEAEPVEGSAEVKCAEVEVKPEVKCEVKPEGKCEAKEDMKEEEKPEVKPEKEEVKEDMNATGKEEEDEMCSTLIDTGDEAHTREPSVSSHDYLFEDLDLSSLPEQSDEVIPSIRSGDEAEYAEMGERFDDLMRGERAEREEIGEEVEGDAVSSDEYFLDGEYLGIEKEKPVEEEKSEEKSEEKPDVKPEEVKSEEKPEEVNSEEKPDVKPEEVKSEEKPEVKTEEESAEEKEPGEVVIKEEAKPEEEEPEKEQPAEEKSEDKPDVPAAEPVEENPEAKPAEEEKEESPGQPWHAIAGDVISMTIADLIPVADTSLRDLFPPPPSPPPILPRSSPCPPEQPEQTPEQPTAPEHPETPEPPPHPDTADKPEHPEHPESPNQPPRPDRTAEEEAKRTQLRAQALAVRPRLASHP